MNINSFSTRNRIPRVNAIYCNETVWAVENEPTAIQDWPQKVRAPAITEWLCHGLAKRGLLIAYTQNRVAFGSLTDARKAAILKVQPLEGNQVARSILFVDEKYLPDNWLDDHKSRNGSSIILSIKRGDLINETQDYRDWYDLIM